MQTIRTGMLTDGVDRSEGIFSRGKGLEGLEFDCAREAIEGCDGIHGSVEEGTDFFEGNYFEKGIAGGGFVEDEEGFGVTHDVG